MVPVTDPTLQVYYDASDTSTYQPSGASGSQITQWNDKSASAHNAAPLGAVSTRPTVSGQVQNGLTALYFDQNDDGLEVPGLTTLRGITASTIMWVGKTLDSGDNQQILCGVRKIGGNFIAVDGYELEISGSASYIVSMAGGSASSDAPLDNNFHLHSIIFDGTAIGNSNRLIHRMDGVQRTLTFASTVGATTSSVIDGIILGADESLLKDFYGYMGSFLLFTKKLSNAELTNTENFLMTKWGKPHEKNLHFTRIYIRPCSGNLEYEGNKISIRF
ncbi:hypothetical protein EBU71_02175 [bacterium]|nr:hypothetical protein [Candidatus Elulimicrobium humile]